METKLLFLLTLPALMIGCHGIDKFFNYDGDLQLPESYSIPWMKAVDDSKLLSALTVPGSHDSLALDGGALVKHQAWPLYRQLQAGIRYVELEVVAIDNTLYVVQGVMYQHTTLTEVLDTLLAFLSQYPSEAVLLHVIPEITNSARVNQMLQDLVAPVQQVWISSGMPTMREVRGKVVFVQKRSTSVGVPALVDGGGDGRVTSIREKESSLTKLLGQVAETCGGDNIIVNHSTFTEWGSLWGMFLTPRRMAERLNPWLYNYLGQYTTDHPRPCFGVLAVDFPGFDLVQIIINLNWY